MFRREVKFTEFQRTPQQRQAHVRMIRQRDADRAKLCNILRFWTICSKGKCHREGRCSGDPIACFDAKWKELPAAFKDALRVMTQASRRGLGHDAAKRAAIETYHQAEAAERDAAVAADERARNASAPGPDAAASGAAASPGPRLRGF